MDPDRYCRDVEAHLCRRNGGHLIRLVGPAFELVREWVGRGIPIKVVFQGIDRHVERVSRRPGRRRPVGIGACEGSVLDAFDDWRRTVGVFQRSAGSPADSRPAGARRSLGRHLDRAVERLVARLSDPETPALNRAVADTVTALDLMREEASRARGAARQQLLARLTTLDAGLVAAARADLASAGLAELEGEAASELEPFRTRMDAPVYARSLDAAVNRLLGQRYGLPRLTYE